MSYSKSKDVLTQDFIESANKLKKMRARFDQRKDLRHEYELFIKFEEECYPLWGLYQQVVVGNINVPKLDYMDPEELSYMWCWIKGNKKWHEWNKCKGLSREEAVQLYTERVEKLEKCLPELVEEWKDEQDPRIPDQKSWVPEVDKEHWEKVSKEAKAERRERSAIQRLHEEKLGMWDE